MHVRLKDAACYGTRPLRSNSQLPHWGWIESGGQWHPSRVASAAGDDVRNDVQVLTEYTNLAASQDAAYEHIDAEARGKVKACVDEVAAWLAGVKSQQAAAVCVAFPVHNHQSRACCRSTATMPDAALTRCESCGAVPDTLALPPRADQDGHAGMHVQGNLQQERPRDLHMPAHNEQAQAQTAAQRARARARARRRRRR